MASSVKKSSRKRWAKHLGGATLVAGALVGGQTAVANPLISDILNRATARAVAAATRREDAEMPAALVLAPADNGGEFLLAGHRSHSSHKSHSSHRSSTTRETNAVSDSKTNAAPKHKNNHTQPGDKLITLKDGSQLIAHATFNGTRALLACKYCQIEVSKKDVKKIKAAPKVVDLQKITAGRCIVKFKRGNEVRADGEIQESSFRLITGSKSRLIPKDGIEKLIRLQEPIKELNSPEECYCVVTLRDGSMLRGKARLDEDTGKYTLRNRFATVTLDKDSVYCIEKVDKVVVMKDASGDSPSTAETADTKKE